MDYWIITERKYPRFESLEDAEQERQRLIRRDGRQRRVLRCKPYLKAARNFPLLVTLLRNILADGVTETARDSAEQLLAAVGERHTELAPQQQEPTS
jgi:hypothetical protein